MVNVRVDDDLLRTLRPLLETEWEKKCHEENRKVFGNSDADIVHRGLQKLFELLARDKDKPKDPAKPNDQDYYASIYKSQK